MEPVPLSDELKAALGTDPTPGGIKYIIATQVSPGRAPHVPCGLRPRLRGGEGGSGMWGPPEQIRVPTRVAGPGFPPHPSNSQTCDLCTQALASTVHPRSARRGRGCAGGLGPGPGVTNRVLSDRHFLEGSRSLSPALTLIPHPPRWDPGLKSWMILALTSWVPMVCRRQPPDRLLDGALAATGRRGRFAGTGNRVWRLPGVLVGICAWPPGSGLWPSWTVGQRLQVPRRSGAGPPGVSPFPDLRPAPC